MSNQYFAQNLRSICSHYKSIADVCRSLEMNRQQFNKYLSGQIYPSKYNLRRICHFFKLTEEQFLLSPAKFSQLTSAQPNRKKTPVSSRVDQMIDNLPVDIEALSHYEGFYHSYFYALGFPGKIIRGLMYIYRENDRFYSKNFELFW